jgi:hypothetical protein
MKEEIASMLIDIFNRLNIDTPNNFDSILNFVIEDVEETADKKNFHDGDVAIAFRRWIENQNKDKDE